MDLSKKIGQFLKKNDYLLSTAESCTAGLIASTLAQTSGSSSWLDSGFVVYSPEAKNRSLGVKFSTIEEYDITSCQVAEEMATGALLNSRANVSVSTTGVAGPNGGTDKIPVGTVCFAWAFRDGSGNIFVKSEKMYFKGERNTIRENATAYSLDKIEFYSNEFKSRDNNKLKMK